MSTDIEPDGQPRDDQGRFASGPDPASMPDEASGGPIDPKDALWDALSDRDRAQLALNALAERHGYRLSPMEDESEYEYEDDNQQWLYNQPQDEPFNPGYPQQGEPQYVTQDQLMQMLQQQREQAEWERYQQEVAEYEEQNLGYISHLIDSKANGYSNIHKESMLFHALREQQQHPYMTHEQIVDNVKSRFDQAERERMANMLPAGSQAAPSMPMAPSNPPPGAPASPQQQPMTIAEASRIAREQGLDLRTGM